MSGAELHQKYAPIMHFSRGERFFPMSADDFLTYTALYVKGQQTPAIPRGRVRLKDLTGRYSSRETFLRSVATGPIHGMEVASEWGTAAIRLIYEWSQNPVVTWTEDLARSAYDWFSEKTKAATQLFWWNNLLLPKAHADKKGSVQKKLPRFQLPQEVRKSAVESYEASQDKDRNYTYYYRTVQQAGYLDLQYWFFYAYMDRIVGAFTFRRDVYAEVEKDTTFTTTAWILVVVIAFLNRLGSNASGNLVNWLAGAVVDTVFAVIGFALAAVVISVVGRALFSAEVTFDELARTLGLAYVWQIVGVIGVMAAFSNALACVLAPVLVIAVILLVIAWLVAAKVALDLEWGQTIVTVILGGIAWIVVMVVVSGAVRGLLGL
ncbi:MAG: YIP1 family protein [Anaerolineales bacterium]|nr:MAG: YIP1 family protein [Anaerolineales bacterium]